MPEPTTLPVSVVEHLRAFGDNGARWVERFPILLGDVARRWSLEIGPPFADLSYSFVAPVRRGAERLVLKLAVPNPELDSEVAALHALAGRGVVLLVDADPSLGALLLERVEPGTRLSEVADDDRRMAIAAEVMTRLWCPAPSVHPFRTVQQWSEGLQDVRPGALSEDLLSHARAVFDERSARSTLMHADFHPFNLLQGGAGRWVAIDPKGAVGHPGFEVGPLLRNLLLDCDDPTRRLDQRIRRLARETPLDDEELLSWGMAGSVLSAVWSMDEGGSGEEAIRCAELMLARLR